MDIKVSRRILAVGAPGSRVLDVVATLTGSAPSPDPSSGSTAGLSHEWDCRTAYYHAAIPVWIDELADVQAWKDDFLKDEARQVVDALGAWIYCFERTQGGRIDRSVKDTLKAIQEIMETHVGYGTDTVMLAVCLPPKDEKDAKGLDRVVFEDWEDACLQFGFEFIDFAAASGKNSFGEKQGVERLREALESNDWAGEEASDEDLDFDDLDFDAVDPFTGERGEMNRELWGLKAALINHQNSQGEDEAEETPYYGEESDQVDALERIMGKVMSAREDISELPEEQRKRKAAQAVQQMMKSHPDI